MPPPDAAKALEELGFSRVEAEVYLFLLERGPASGYAIAQGLGKAAAGVYKVLDGLTARGAAGVDAGSTRLYRAAPREELLDGLARRFEERRERAARALAEVREIQGDDRVYRIEAFDAAVDRFREMLGRARSVALI